MPQGPLCLKGRFAYTRQGERFDTSCGVLVEKFRRRSLKGVKDSWEVNNLLHQEGGQSSPCWSISTRSDLRDFWQQQVSCAVAYWNGKC